MPLQVFNCKSCQGPFLGRVCESLSTTPPTFCSESCYYKFYDKHFPWEGDSSAGWIAYMVMKRRGVIDPHLEWKLEWKIRQKVLENKRCQKVAEQLVITMRLTKKLSELILARALAPNAFVDSEAEKFYEKVFQALVERLDLLSLLPKT